MGHPLIIVHLFVQSCRHSPPRCWQQTCLPNHLLLPGALIALKFQLVLEKRTYSILSRAKRTQIERKKNVPRTDPQIREVSGNDFNPAMEPRTETIVENKNVSFYQKKWLILNISKNLSKNFNLIGAPGTITWLAGKTAAMTDVPPGQNSDWDLGRQRVLTGWCTSCTRYASSQHAVSVLFSGTSNLYKFNQTSLDPRKTALTLIPTPKGKQFSKRSSYPPRCHRQLGRLSERAQVPSTPCHDSQATQVMSLDLKLFEACEESHGIRCQRLGCCGQNIEEWHQKSSSPTKYMCDSSISAQQFKTILHFRRSLQRLRRGLEDALCILPWADQHELLIFVKSPVNTEPYERLQPLLRSFFLERPPSTGTFTCCSF